MKRDFNKHLGGLWEATAGGSALKGEAPIQCAKRELFEETGIIPKEIRQVDTIVHRRHQTIYCEFVCTADTDKSSVTLQSGETIDFKWIRWEE